MYRKHAGDGSEEAEAEIDYVETDPSGRYGRVSFQNYYFFN